MSDNTTELSNLHFKIQLRLEDVESREALDAIEKPLRWIDRSASNCPDVLEIVRSDSATCYPATFYPAPRGIIYGVSIFRDYFKMRDSDDVEAKFRLKHHVEPDAPYTVYIEFQDVPQTQSELHLLSKRNNFLNLTEPPDIKARREQILRQIAEQRAVIAEAKLGRYLGDDKLPCLPEGEPYTPRFFADYHTTMGHKIDTRNVEKRFKQFAKDSGYEFGEGVDSEVWQYTRWRICQRVIAKEFNDYLWKVARIKRP